MGTKIEWADITTNPVVGCSKCSPACDNCYAERHAARLAKNPVTAAKYAGVVDARGKWTGITNFDVSCLTRLPKMPKRIFVGSMCDFFHDSVTDAQLAHIMGHIGLTSANAHHIFMLLTKRPKRMRDFFISWKPYREMSNLWIGVTVCNQQEADEKIPLLLATPAAKRFVSIEPMLGAVDLGQYLHKDCDCEMCTYGNGHGPVIDWVICGGETGPKARPMHPDWVRGLRDQCAAAGTPFFFKGWGEWACIYDRDIDDPDYINCPKATDKKERYLNIAGGHGFNGKRVMFMRRVGMARAGRLLDGVEYGEVPHGR